jgi:uncharacterized surface protein with fasciclin (FAS1) repeats
MTNGVPGNLQSAKVLPLFTQGLYAYDTVNGVYKVLVPTSDGWAALNPTTASGTSIQQIP